MKPPVFDYVRAGSVDEALDVLASEGGDARIIAGGQTLMAMLNMRLMKPATLVDITRIAGLNRIEERDGTLLVGAAVRQADLLASPHLGDHPLLAAALPWVGHAQTRNAGTVCGSVAHADPSAELPLVLTALGGEVHLRSRRRARRVKANDFFLGTMTTEKQDDEMIEAVSFPRVGGGVAFREIARRHGDFAIVACAAIVRDGKARLAVGGVANRPVARELEGDLDAALDAFAWDLEARDDIHATARYRRELVRRIGRQVIEEARR